MDCGGVGKEEVGGVGEMFFFEFDFRDFQSLAKNRDKINESYCNYKC